MPHLPEGLQSEVATAAIMKDMIRRLLLENGIREFVFWYYTPIALTFTDGFKPVATIYDCMDELSAFKGANSRLPFMERQLFVGHSWRGPQGREIGKRRLPLPLVSSVSDL